MIMIMMMKREEGRLKLIKVFQICVGCSNSIMWARVKYVKGGSGPEKPKVDSGNRP